MVNIKDVNRIKERIKDDKIALDMIAMVLDAHALKDEIHDEALKIMAEHDVPTEAFGALCHKAECLRRDTENAFVIWYQCDESTTASDDVFSMVCDMYDSIESDYKD